MSYLVARHACLPKLRQMLCSLAFALVCTGTWSTTEAREGERKVYPRLPLGMDEFQAVVDKLAGEASGDKAALAEKLMALGFSCTPVSEGVQFVCVRFGCRKWRGFLWQGALLQWSVKKYREEERFIATAINYSLYSGCVSERDVEEKQENFLSKYSVP